MNRTLYDVKTSLAHEAPNILTGLGVTGLITTTVLAVKATPKAMEILELNAYARKIEIHQMELVEVIKLAWKPYLPTAIVGGLTIACILSANSINLKRNAALAGLYTIATESLREYQAKVVEMVGDKKEQRIRDDIAQDRLEADPIGEKNVIFAGGEALFYDSLSGRYFQSSMETVRRAQNDFNYELMQEMYKPLNEFYDFIGLEGTELGRNMGWNVDNGQLDIKFSAKLAKNDEPCVVLDYHVEPRFL